MTSPQTTPDVAPAPLRGKLGVRELQQARQEGRRLVMVTAYDYPGARLAERAGIDLLLVGDSAGMVVLGHESTTSVTMDEMVLFTRAVTRGAVRAFVVADMPFMSHQPDTATALRNAGRLVAEGRADAVKLEGAGRTIERISAITDAGIPVFGHLGLTPQSATLLGGYRAQARRGDEAMQLIDDARAIEDAGAVALVLEAIPAEVARVVTERAGIPTIGIGAGAATDGQVLVAHDLLGISDGHLPRFVERFGSIGEQTAAALGAYAAAVREGTFPQQRHTYTMPQEELEALRERLDD